MLLPYTSTDMLYTMTSIDSHWISNRYYGGKDVCMVSIDDYLNGQANSDDQYTIARIVESNEIDLFVMYNRAEGVNSEVLGHRDQVTIVRQKGDGTQSWLEAGLDGDGSFQW